MTELKEFFGKVWQSVQNYLNQDLVIGSFLDNYFDAILTSKANFLSVWKKHFSVFCKLSDEVGTIFCEYETNLSHNLAIESFLENGFEGTLSWKTNVLSISKEHFSVFCKFYSDEVETFSGKVRQSTENYLNKHWW